MSWLSQVDLRKHSALMVKGKKTFKQKHRHLGENSHTVLFSHFTSTHGPSLEHPPTPPLHHHLYHCSPDQWNHFKRSFLRFTPAWLCELGTLTSLGISFLICKVDGLQDTPSLNPPKRENLVPLRVGTWRHEDLREDARWVLLAPELSGYCCQVTSPEVFLMVWSVCKWPVTAKLFTCSLGSGHKGFTVLKQLPATVHSACPGSAMRQSHKQSLLPVLRGIRARQRIYDNWRENTPLET
jgi:hypothetical protein